VGVSSYITSLLYQSEPRVSKKTMSKVYKNTYTPPKVEIKDYHPDTTEAEYDHNFVFEVKALKSERVELRPFIVSSSKA